MINIVKLLTRNHEQASRDYLKRMSMGKPKCMNIASQFEEDYWDGDRQFGYGGYSYDGRWKVIAHELIEQYGLTEESRILDLGCGMGHLIFELKSILNCKVKGVDISQYAKSNTLEEIRDDIFIADLRKPLSFKDKEFDLVLSIMVLHNLELPDLQLAISELIRVSKKSYIAVESFRSNQELFNLQCWALTCKSFLSPREWEWFLSQNGYIERDLELLYFS